MIDQFHLSQDGGMVKWHSINENECIETFYHSPEDSSTQAGIKHQSFIEVNKRQVKFRRDDEKRIS